VRREEVEKDDGIQDMTTIVFSYLSDHALLAEARRFADDERHATARLIALLMELDARRLYLGEGYSSLFAFCTQALRLSEHAAYIRIAAARAARRFPAILDLLCDGSINLTTVTVLAPELTPENHREVLESARLKSKIEIQRIAASLHPRPAVPSSVRKLPAPKSATPLTQSVTTLTESNEHREQVAPPAEAILPPSRPPVVAPLAPERYKIQFTVTHETYEKLRRAQDLLRHVVPNDDPAVIFDRALTMLLEDVARTKLAATDRPRRSSPPRAGSRHIPADVKRAVWVRDGGQCTFVGKNGRRCGETGFLEVHHVLPHAAGGAATVENLRLYCAAHNRHEADLFFGPSQPSVVRELADPEYGLGHQLGLERVLGRSGDWAKVERRTRREPS
jgi:hypothetical protein